MGKTFKLDPLQTYVWYAHDDDKPNFDDFQAFGGWKFPIFKRYKQNVDLCGVKVDLIYEKL